MTNRERLVAQITHQQETGRRIPIVSLQEFFEGNEDYSSIGCNLDGPYTVPPVSAPVPYWPHPGPQGFYQVLQSVRARDDVQDVLVEISDPDVGEEDWPFSERVYILTSASVEQVEAWTAKLFPTEVSEGYDGEKPALAPDLLPGYQAYALWWD